MYKLYHAECKLKHLKILRLLWILILGHLVNICLRTLTSIITTTTKCQLSQLTALRYSKLINIPMLICHEVLAVVSDLQCLVLSTIAITLMLNVQIWAGALLAMTLHIILFVGYKFTRSALMGLVLVLVALVGMVFWAQIDILRLDPLSVVTGIFVPKLAVTNSYFAIISLLGSCKLNYLLSFTIYGYI